MHLAVLMKRQFIQGIFEIFQQVIRYNLVWGSLRLIKREAFDEKRKLYQTRLYKYNLLAIQV